MRPGRVRPGRGSFGGECRQARTPRFNEAGARTPRKSQLSASWRRLPRRFNEAGARTPQKSIVTFEDISERGY